MSGRQGMYDHHISIFSPEGRLYQVEYALQAAKTVGGETAVGVRGKDSVAVVISKKVPDKSMDKDFVTRLYQINKKIGACMTGMHADSRAIVFKAREIASNFKQDNGYDIPVHYLAEKVADQGQVYTQYAYGRPYGASALFISLDDERGPQLYRVEPSGTSHGYKAVAVGAKEPEATNQLEKAYKSKSDPDETETIQRAIACLQVTLQMDFKAADIEVGVVSNSRVGFVKLGAEEIDVHLNAIADRD
uniref:Proteasome subunit alpha type n=1 Tax=Noctiluca scintillans TaxID=2966 RepID=A0A7S1EXX5_NOCSC|mmetsp:Transcript_18308/g.49215  ORF Transcript_18308/g.49215 Transcript_18308/m.49215 type:complete len:247 (+) Transcript_18308:79-819(+)|eukprot:CAMPEP_0194504082 /NCGR_PEP_ID=MMETSP0253-20130528/28743_1 /TAXON_ID=2966 /ORGANISM="Noctiluca scintillans" /LENGTH=246 /DNA_ID=CAMNT_0039346433 /DNA_START=79 /DNA_END=819 /DNA_ORIENTATION=+